MKSFFQRPFLDVMACLERIVVDGRRRQGPGPLIVVMVALIVTWFLYVPIHELLHAYGCIWTGGDVTRLEVSPRYGGKLLANYFPFVVSGSDYAGQLTGFDTKGSDAIYMATVFAPFVLSIVFGVPLLKLCARRKRTVLFGVSIVLGLAPFYNFSGDYYEMGSILTTRAITLVSGGSNPPLYEGIRSDDVFKLVGEVMEKPAERGLTTGWRVAIGSVLIAVSFALSLFLAFLTYWLGHLFSLPFFGRGKRSPAPT